jgi:AGZA family xanthine/uracil permease-like MFS transporter
MVVPLTKIDWKNPADALPSFLTLVLIPFTYSLSIGISFGFISYTFLQLAAGKRKEIHPILIWISLLSIFFLAL